MMKQRFHIVTGCIWGLVFVFSATAAVEYDRRIPQLAFAVEKVKAALSGADATVVFEIKPDAATPESFTITRPEPSRIVITGSDAAGAMYGGLEVAEELRIGGLKAVQPDQQKPAMELRGIKFNIPLDVRTPSYSDLGDAGQFNIPHMWDLDFWKEFIDEMAAHRYNYLSLWNLHPFPSLVKVPDYPDVALDDVKRAVGLEKKFYNGRGQEYDRPEILDETETLITMTIDEKIDFWRNVMAYAKQRNVDIYFVTWNVFDYGTQGKYGITDALDNEVTKDYFRKSVKQLFLTYPGLKGIGITTGENMHDASNQEKEDWMLATYGMGILDVVKEQPERKITFLHRQHQAGAGVIADTFKPLIDHPNVDFIFSYKYAQAHSYSSTEQPFYKSGLEKEIEGRDDDLKTIWTMRNDSTYWFRWAAPDFMREFVQNIPMELTRGYYFGSDGWIWGRDFITKTGDWAGELEIKRHWLQWLLWGRLAYDSGISNERIAGIVQAHFPDVAATKLLNAWQKASMVYPLTTGFHWGALDFHWYPEACIGVRGNKLGFHDVESFIKLSPHPGTEYKSIKRTVDLMKKGKASDGTGPLEVSAQLLANAQDALDSIGGFDAGQNTELTETLKDIEAMALLSRYYGHKINGSFHVHLFREMGDQKHQAQAVESLERAADAWRAYAANVSERYVQPQWLCRMRKGPDVNKTMKWVEQDIEVARQAKPKN